MKRRKTILIGIPLLFVLLIGGGFLLPASYRVDYSVLIRAPADAIFKEVGDFKNWSSWMVWGESDPEITVGSYNKVKRTTGKGAIVTYRSQRHGYGSCVIQEFDPPKKISYKVFFADKSLRLTEAITLDEQNHGVTKVTWTGEGLLGGNPLVRYLPFWVANPLKAEMSESLERLKVLVEKKQVGLEKAL